MDCRTKIIPSDNNIMVNSNDFAHATYSPVENRVCLIPRLGGEDTNWYYIKPFTASNCSIQLASSFLVDN